MTSQQEEYFKLLFQRRTIITEAAEDPASEKIWDGLIDKYTDNAHFVYELLQNASDAGATKARFELHRDKLLFAHNGGIHFTITDPEKSQEIKAKADGTLGSVNAITSIGNSTKKNIEAKIGKFGIGFKAVYRYTETPYIYSPGGMFFRLEKKILPVVVHEDYPLRQPKETLFVLPFNSSYTSAEEAYASIEKRIGTLLYPTLFLNELDEVTCSIDDRTIVYSKSIDSSRSFSRNDLTVQLVHVTGREESERLWLMSRKLNGLTYSIGFFVGENGNLVPKTCPAFCFFPTREQTGLNFVVHAPFRVNESREGLKEDDEHNKTLMTLLSSLAADAIECMGEMTQDNGSALLSDTVLDIIPLTSAPPAGLSPLFVECYKCAHEEILKTFCTKKILPGQDGRLYDKSHSICSWDGKLQACFSEQLLSELLGQEFHWVFVNTGNTPNKHIYVEKILRVISYEDIARKISSAFIEKQSIEWLHEFYAYISDSKMRISRFKKIPILLDTQKRAFSAFDSEDKAQVYLPPESENNIIEGTYHFVNKELLCNKETKSFITALGVKTPDLEDYFDKVLLPQCDRHFKDFGEAAVLLINIFKLIDKISYPTRCKVTEILNKVPIFICKNLYDNRRELSSLGHVYYPDKELIEYFQLARCDTGGTRILFVDIDYYNVLFKFSESEKEEFERHLRNFRFLRHPEIICINEDIGRLVKTGVLTKIKAARRNFAVSTSMLGMIESLHNFTDANNISAKKSFLLWHFLLDTLQRESKRNGLFDIFLLKTEGTNGQNVVEKLSNCKSPLAKITPWAYLLETGWLVDCNGKFRKPGDITRQELNEKYEMGYCSDVLIRNLGIKDALVINSDLSPKKKEMLSLIEAEGINTLEELQDVIHKGKAQKDKEQKQPLPKENKDIPQPGLSSHLRDIQEKQPGNVPSSSPNVTQPRSPTTADIPKDENVNCSKKLTEVQKSRIEDATHGPEHETPPKIESTVIRTKRDPNVKDYVQDRDNGICQLCGKPGPFVFNGRNYLEVHHIVALKDGGADTPENAVAICPNCHRKMEILHLPEDVKTLQERILKKQQT